MSNNAQAFGANLFWLSKKRSRNPELKVFGKWLADRRIGKYSREQISIRLEKLGSKLGGSTLAQYEKGTVWAPDPGVLWGLSKIYRVPLEEVMRLLQANRANPAAQDLDDLSRHETEYQSAPSQEGADVPASARVQQSAPRAPTDQLEEIQAIASRLNSIAIALMEDRKTRSAASRRARRARKTG